MTFEFMPELKWRWGYFVLLGIMSVIGIRMILYCKKKNWL